MLQYRWLEDDTLFETLQDKLGKTSGRIDAHGGKEVADGTM